MYQGQFPSFAALRAAGSPADPNSFAMVDPSGYGSGGAGLPYQWVADDTSDDNEPLVLKPTVAPNVLKPAGVDASWPPGRWRLSGMPVPKATSNANALALFAFAKRADMQTFSAPYGCDLYVEEVDAVYRWVPSLTPNPALPAVDGWTVLAPNQLPPGVYGGRFYLRSKEISLGPGWSGAVDDAPYVSSAVAACAGKVQIRLRGINAVGAHAAFTFATPCTVVSNTRIVMDSDVEIVMTMAPTGGAGGSTNCAFYGIGAVTSTTTLAANATYGDKTVFVNGNLAQGQVVLLTGDVLANVGFQATVVSSTAVGDGTYRVVLDETVLYSFVGGSVVELVNPLSNVTIDFNRATISGTGDRYFEMSLAYRCTVRGLRAPASANGHPTAFLGSMDVGGRENLIEDCTGDCGETDLTTSCYNGFALESNLRSRVVRCTVRGARSWNTPIITGFLCKVESSAGLAGNYGIGLLTGGPTDTAACTLCTVDSGNYSNNAVIGIYVDNNSTGNCINRTAANDNTVANAQVGTNGSPAVSRTIFSECDLSYVPVTGNCLFIPPGMGVTTLRNCRVYSAGALAVSTASDLVVDGGHYQATAVQGSNARNIYVLGAANVTITTPTILELVVGATLGGASVFLDGCSGKIVVHGNFKFSGAGTGIGIQDATSATYYLLVGDIRTIGFCSAETVLTLIGTIGAPTFVRAPGCDTSSIQSAGVGAQIGFATGTAVKNYGTVTLGAGTGTIPWTKLFFDGNDPTPPAPAITLKTQGGTRGAGGLQVTPVSGTGWTLQAVDLTGANVNTDTSTYEYYLPAA